jgi:hypothetical protein
LTNVLVAVLLCAATTSCVQPKWGGATGALQGRGLVVVVNLAPGAATKVALAASTDTGAHVAMPSTLTPINGGTGSYGGRTMDLPRWVRFTWREGVLPGQYETTGTIVGDYRVEVRSRIPSAVLEHIAAARGRTLVLRFRVKDDGVLLAWDVRQSSANGQGWNYAMHGGDFRDPTVDNGKVVDPGW